MVVTLIITVGVEVPIDNQLKTWTASDLPANWESLRHKWDAFHTTRTFTAIAGVCAFAWGMTRRL